MHWRGTCRQMPPQLPPQYLPPTLGGATSATCHSFPSSLNCIHPLTKPPIGPRTNRTAICPPELLTVRWSAAHWPGSRTCNKSDMTASRRHPCRPSPWKAPSAGAPSLPHWGQPTSMRANTLCPPTALTATPKGATALGNKPTLPPPTQRSHQPDEPTRGPPRGTPAARAYHRHHSSCCRLP
jgi:hypothetical protein